MAQSGRDYTPAAWSFRWLYNQPEVTVVLSGMNSAEMVKENCRTASEAKAGAFTKADFEVLARVNQFIRAKEKVGCRGTLNTENADKEVLPQNSIFSHNKCVKINT